MQAEGKLEPGQMPRYTSTLNGFISIARSEGIKGLYKVSDKLSKQKDFGLGEKLT